MNPVVCKSKLYDLAKCLTTILVVVAHATRMYTPNGAVPVANQSALLNCFTQYIYAFHLPLFVMLSGCVYGYCLEAGKYTTGRSFLMQKGKRLLIPYFAFGLFYVAPVMTGLGLAGAGYSDYVIYGIMLSNDARHLWYLPALFWIFLICSICRPLLVKGIRELIVAGVISVLIFAAARILPDAFQIRAACDYQLFFFLGILFNRFYREMDGLFRRYYVVGFFLPVILLAMFFFNPNSLSACAYKGIGVGMMMIFCWGLLRRFPGVIDHPLLRCIKRNAFGIYLFHPMIVYVLFRLLGKYDLAPAALSVFVSAVSIFLSIWATEGVRMLHLHLLIGE